MSAKFKFKPSKNKFASEKIYSLNDIHKEKMNLYFENKQKLPSKYSELENLKNKLKAMEKSKTPINIKVKVELKNKIEVLQEEIYKLEKNDDVKNYISKTSKLIVNYYNISSNMSDNEQNSMSSSEENDSDQENIGCSENLILLNKINQQNKKVKKIVKKRFAESDGPKNKSIINFFGIDNNELNKNTLSRNNIQDKYISLVTENSDKYKNNKLNLIVQCSVCKVEKILFRSEGCYACPKCGEVEYIAIDSEIPSHKDSINEKQKYPYKKINHLKEKLSQLQSKESINIRKKIIKEIKIELKRKRIPLDMCEPMDIRDILKKLKLTDYYEHIQQIYCRITKKPPVTLTRNIEDTIINMFNSMQESFKKHKPAGRSNFLNYAYTLNRLFNLINMPDYAKFFILLKKDKLKDQDSVWKKICQDQDWDYLKSIGRSDENSNLKITDNNSDKEDSEEDIKEEYKTDKQLKNKTDKQLKNKTDKQLENKTDKQN